MSGQDSVAKLLEEACPSIQYRIRRDILKQSVHEKVMIDLQAQILMDAKVQEVMSWQHSDGWLGGNFHGDCEPETGIRFLIEKGVSKEHPVVISSLKAIVDRQEQFDLGSLERVGKLLHSHRLGGSQMIKACVFAYGGQEEHDFVQQQIEEALYGFSAILCVSDKKLLYHMHKDKLAVFNHGMICPSIYHLRLLAYTSSWRTPENLQLLSDALNHMLRLCPLPEIKLLHKAQIVAPAQMDFMNVLSKPTSALSPKEWMLFFHQTELISRLGIADDIPAVHQQIDQLLFCLQSSDWLFTKSLSHYYFHRWSPYIGLALENDWKSKNKRIYDLTFRCLLILSFSHRLQI